MMRFIAQLKISPTEIHLPTIAADNTLFTNILNLIYGLLAATAIFFIVRGALLFVTSNSDQNSIKQARETILYAAVGLVASTAVFALIQFVVKSLGGN